MCNYNNTGFTFNTTDNTTTQCNGWYNFGRNPQICRDTYGNVWIRRGQNCGCCHHHGGQCGCGCGENNTDTNDVNGTTGGNGFACVTYCGAAGRTGTTFGLNGDTYCPRQGGGYNRNGRTCGCNG